MAKIKSENKFDYLALGLMVLYFVLFSALSIGRHESLKSYLNDLGTCDQVIWNTMQGRFFENSANMLNEPNYLGSHFSLVFLLFVPLYKLVATPNWLLVGQVLSVVLGAIPIYLLAREKLNDLWGARIFLLGFLLFPFLQNGVLYDFHEVVFAVGFAAWAFYFLEKEKYWGFGVMATLLAVSQEQLPLVVLMMGLYLIFVKRKTKFGLAVVIISAAYFALALAVFIPHFSSTGQSAILVNNSAYPSRYAWLGKNPSEILKNVISHPVQIGTVVISAERLRYLVMLLTPVFSLALLHWSILIILPILAINLLSANGMTFNVYFYHSAILTPFIFGSAILALAHWFGDNQFIKRVFFLLILISTLYCGIVFSLAPFSGKQRIADFLPDAHAKNIQAVKKIIPAEASLSVQHNLGPHFSERRNIWRFPLQVECAEYVILDKTDPYRVNPEQVFGFDYALQLAASTLKVEIKKMENGGQYQKIYDEDGFVVFKNNQSCKLPKR